MTEQRRCVCSGWLIGLIDRQTQPGWASQGCPARFF